MYFPMTEADKNSALHRSTRSLKLAVGVDGKVHLSAFEFEGLALCGAYVNGNYTDETIYCDSCFCVLHEYARKLTRVNHANP